MQNSVISKKDKFLRTLLFKVDFEAPISNEVFFILDDERFIKFKLDDPLLKGHYDSVTATVVSKMVGVIDTQQFDFGTLVPDKDNKHPNAVFKDLHAKYDKNTGYIDWFIDVPTSASVDAFNEAVNQYIKLFK